ncbi:2-C-methyl-D-erythritol 2,4-cyclodiphosphate synthase [Deferribacterales bacterium Es71-Z0220]|jgi:2-C-methyl-D-erythritol 2,4-cyclodiphosphate synthase|uniref:2-C-methyl-D-erythritol 2,4-cyclodiphosphate synthase n=1 Tax=Deferrivibrio essentukiensis TaxID=2880922 RepID=UPI001F614872|nr:2-C-methyl-D-erythritol 2,4-cyclodiphosphate synthase [Deferrivibrio essentukiensis]MCB4203399.1 2-C-methyl-D-erythritol 2,4-cyclodiphosphate synthase [Deferrivibrio essentukiensis]
MKIKTGIGIDAHRFCENRPLIVGGIKIDFEFGLLGHSDADVLIHAIIDSLVGPALGKDIGQIFPDNDDRFKNIDSKVLLKESVRLIKEKNYQISHVDAEIIGEKPKFKSYIHLMRETLAQTMEIDIDDITIKATTTEKMGFTGRGEGLAAIAVSTLVKL